MQLNPRCLKWYQRRCTPKILEDVQTALRSRLHRLKLRPFFRLMSGAGKRKEGRMCKLQGGGIRDRGIGCKSRCRRRSMLCHRQTWYRKPNQGRWCNRAAGGRTRDGASCTARRGIRDQRRRYKPRCRIRVKRTEEVTLLEVVPRATVQAARLHYQRRSEPQKPPSPLQRVDGQGKLRGKLKKLHRRSKEYWTNSATCVQSKSMGSTDAATQTENLGHSN